MTLAPTAIRAHREQRRLELEWPDGRVDSLPFRHLRCECPCAVCVDEVTGRRVLKPESVPDTIAVHNIGFVGNYALRVEWSDGHSTGLYTWERLRHLGESR